MGKSFIIIWELSIINFAHFNLNHFLLIIMRFLKIKLIFFTLISSFFIKGFSPINAFEIERVKGNCRPFNCQLLLQDLQINWQEQIDEWLNSPSCQDKNTLGLNVWEKGKRNRVVSFICWEEIKDPHRIYGNFLGILPFPKDEENFGSEWNCLDDLQCKNYVEDIKNFYPQNSRELEVMCGIKDGELRLLIKEDTIDIKCVFFEPNTQIDNNLDGVSDGATAKPTGVDITIGRFDLE